MITKNLRVEIYDLDDRQFLPAHRGLRFSKAWQGGEDIACSFVLDRSSSRDWPDVGYGHTVIVREGLDALWRGYIRAIDQGVEEIRITAAGTSALLDDYTYIGGTAPAGTFGRLWDDTRYGRWLPVTRQGASNAFRPELYEMDTDARLSICPRDGETYGTTGTNKYGAFYYTCPYDTIKRVTFTYDFVDPDNWEVELVSMDANRANQNVEWTLAATAAGAADQTLATDRARLELKLYYNAANAAYAGGTEAGCRIVVTALHVYGLNDVAPTVTDVATDIVAQLQAGTDIENDVTQIEAIALTLSPLFYEKAETCLEGLRDAASFGDANYEDIAWGVESGGARLFLRAPDRDAMRYVVPAEHCRRLSAKGGTYQGYCSAATGTYIDANGEQQFTDTYYAHVTTAGIVANTTATGDDLASAVYGVEREEVVDFGRLGAVLAAAYIQEYVTAHGHPQVNASFEVFGEVQDLLRGGAWIMPYEMLPGYLVQVPHFRAVEAEGVAGVDLREWDTTFMLAGLDYDAEQGAAKLVPEGAPDDLEKILEVSRRFGWWRVKAMLKKRGHVLGK